MMRCGRAGRRGVRVEQRHDGAEGGVDAGDRVADGHPDPHRRAVGVADQFAHAADRLCDGGEAGALGHRPGLPERRDPRDDQVGIGLVQPVGPESPLLQGAGPEVLQQHVAVPDQVEHDPRPRSVFRSSTMDFLFRLIVR